jgi:hypothetical protein
MGVERLTQEELADFANDVCLCGSKQHSPENLRKLRTRILRFLDVARGDEWRCQWQPVSVPKGNDAVKKSGNLVRATLPGKMMRLEALYAIAGHGVDIFPSLTGTVR